MRNLSRNSLKRLLRPANGMAPGYAYRHTRYPFHNYGGAQAWVQSKGQINNLTCDGLKRYLTPAQRLVWWEYIR